MLKRLAARLRALVEPKLVEKQTVWIDKNCQCLTCPSYPEHCKGELAFCLRGKAPGDLELVTCNCTKCPVAKAYGFTEKFHCMTGRVPVELE